VRDGVSPPTMPMTSPTTFLAVDASPIHPATTTAAKSGVVELRMAAREAVRLSCEVAMSVKAAAAFRAEDQELLPSRPERREAVHGDRIKYKGHGRQKYPKVQQQRRSQGRNRDADEELRTAPQRPEENQCTQISRLHALAASSTPKKSSGPSPSLTLTPLRPAGTPCTA
jgi:hypothetical protein